MLVRTKEFSNEKYGNVEVSDKQASLHERRTYLYRLVPALKHLGVSRMSFAILMKSLNERIASVGRTHYVLSKTITDKKQVEKGTNCSMRMPWNRKHSYGKRNELLMKNNLQCLETRRQKRKEVNTARVRIQKIIQFQRF